MKDGIESERESRGGHTWGDVALTMNKQVGSGSWISPIFSFGGLWLVPNISRLLPFLPLGEKWEKRIEKWKISRTAEGTSERKKIPPITEVRQTKSYCNTLLRNRKMANYLPARISVRMPTCGAFPALELACHVAVRSEAFHAKAFYASLAATSLCVVLLPLFVTNTLSYGAAVKVCYERTSSRLSSMFLDEDSREYR